MSRHILTNAFIALLLLCAGALQAAAAPSGTGRVAAAAALFPLADPRAAVDWKVIQRNTPGSGRVALKMFYALEEPGVLQAEVRRADDGQPLPGQSYSDNQWFVPSSPGTAADFSIDSVATGGNYDVALRLLRTSDGGLAAEAAISEIAVGDVYLAAGQSNMSGYSESLANAEAPLDQVHVFGNDYVWKRASEPMDSGTGQIDLVSLDFPTHSLMLRFAKDLFAATGVPIAVIPGSLGGSSLATQWQRDPASPANRNTLYGSLLYRTRIHGYDAPPAGVLWFQGESDAASTSPSYYRGLLEELIAAYRQDLADPALDFIVAQLGTYTYAWLPGWIAVQEAQRQVARSDAHVALVTVIDQPTHDTIHYTTEAYKAIGTRFAAAARQMIYAQPVDALTELLGVSASPDGRSVILDYDAPVSAAAPGMYRIADAQGLNAVTAANAVGATVVLNLARGLSGQAYATYGWSRYFNSPWSVDASGRAVPAFRYVTVTP